MPPQTTDRPLSAREAHARARPGHHVIGWKLDAQEREELLRRFAPRYARAVADHVTLRARVAAQSALPPPAQGVIVGRADDGHGVEAMVVQVDGSVERPGGGRYHITWSLDAGRRPVESNDVIAACGWQPVEPPVPVRLQPARFP
jgi:hypothetical protein